MQKTHPECQHVHVHVTICLAIWRSHDKNGIKSLETRGALGRLLSVDYFGSGETLILTDVNHLVKGLKPRAMDENILRISRSWNRVDPKGEVSNTALPGLTELGGEARWDPEVAWVQTSPYRSLMLPTGDRAWMRVDDGFVQHQQPYWREIPQDMPVDADLTPNWEEEVPRPVMPRPPKYKLRSRDAHASHGDVNWDADRALCDDEKEIATECTSCGCN
eukprot:3601302-Amphidinium_carterae.2